MAAMSATVMREDLNYNMKSYIRLLDNRLWPFAKVTKEMTAWRNTITVENGFQTPEARFTFAYPGEDSRAVLGYSGLGPVFRNTN